MRFNKQLIINSKLLFNFKYLYILKLKSKLKFNYELIVTKTPQKVVTNYRYKCVKKRFVWITTCPSTKWIFYSVFLARNPFTSWACMKVLYVALMFAGKVFLKKKQRKFRDRACKTLTNFACIIEDSAKFQSKLHNYSKNFRQHGKI